MQIIESNVLRKYLFNQVHDIIQHSQKVEITWVSSDRWMNKDGVVYPLFNFLKEENSDMLQHD